VHPVRDGWSAPLSLEWNSYAPRPFYLLSLHTRWYVCGLENPSHLPAISSEAKVNRYRGFESLLLRQSVTLGRDFLRVGNSAPISRIFSNQKTELIDTSISRRADTSSVRSPGSRQISVNSNPAARRAATPLFRAFGFNSNRRGSSDLLAIGAT
jgi:hypothetical protein